MAIHDSPSFGLKLLVHLLRCPAVISKVLTKLDPDDFNRAGEQPKKLLWAISRDYFVKYREVIPQAILQMEVEERLKNAPGVFSAEDLSSMSLDIMAAYMADPDTDFQAAWVLEQVSSFIKERKLLPQIQLAASMSAGDEMDAILAGVQRVQQQSKLSTVEEERIFTRGTKTTVSVERRPTGVTYIDHMLQGGTTPKELYGILAPSGGGKTTTGIAIIVEQARLKRHAAFFSYETEVQPEISNRMYMVAGNIPRAAFKDIKSLDALAVAHANSLDTALDELSPYLHVCDMKKNLMRGVGNGGPDEIREKLIEYKDNGTPVDVVVIDQLLSMLAPYMAANNIKAENKREAIINLVEALRDICQALSCCIFILHQTDNQAKRKKPACMPTGGQAAEDKSFENNMHFCLQFGTQDSKGISWLTAVKHRSSAPDSIIVQQDPDYWKIKWEPDKWALEGNCFQLKRNDIDSFNTVKASDVDKQPKDYMDV